MIAHQYDELLQVYPLNTQLGYSYKKGQHYCWPFFLSSLRGAREDAFFAFHARGKDKHFQ